MTAGANHVLLYFTGGIGSCMLVLVVLYNLVAVALYLREETEGRSSAMAIVAWAMGVLSTLLWWMPCVGGIAGMFAVVVSRLERGRIYRDESSLAGATPVRMGSVNGWLAIAMHSVLMLALVSSWAFA
ncbi:MAG: hypothetical protein ABMB14_12990 [Myxococcota bacterium]